MAKVQYRKCRKDGNHAEIIKFARMMGAYVIDTSIIPNSFDILIAWDGKLIPVEIKDGTLPQGRRTLTNGESKCKENLEYRGVKYNIVESPEDLIKLLKTKEIK